MWCCGRSERSYSPLPGQDNCNSRKTDNTDNTAPQLSLRQDSYDVDTVIEPYAHHELPLDSKDQLDPKDQLDSKDQFYPKELPDSEHYHVSRDQEERLMLENEERARCQHHDEVIVDKLPDVELIKPLNVLLKRKRTDPKFNVEMLEVIRETVDETQANGCDEKSFVGSMGPSSTICDGVISTSSVHLNPVQCARSLLLRQRSIQPGNIPSFTSLVLEVR